MCCTGLAPRQAQHTLLGNNSAFQQNPLRQGNHFADITIALPRFFGVSLCAGVPKPLRGLTWRRLWRNETLDLLLFARGRKGWTSICKLTWLVLGGDPAARSHRVEQFTAL